MTFRTLTLADALAVTTRMRKEDADCLRAVSEVTSPELYALSHWQTEGAAWTLLDGDDPVAIGGVKLPVPWIGVVWMVCTDGMTPASWKKLLRHGRTVLANASKQEPLRRVECYVLSTWGKAREFAERSGFELESVRHAAGRDGQDVLTYVYRGKP